MSKVILVAVVACGFTVAAGQASGQCIENSPERRGEEGCTILENKPLLGPVTKPLYWHIDRFDSLEGARAVAGPDSVAAEAHGSVWLMSVEPQTDDHRGGRHVAMVGPLALPPAAGYSMQVMSALFKPGTASGVHNHPGPEVFYMVAGEQCLETPQGGYRTGVGQAHVAQAGVPMRVKATGSTLRRALVLILHDAAHPAIHNLEEQATVVACN